MDPIKQRINNLLQEKAEKKTLYVARDVLNGDEIIKWAKAQGFNKCVSPDDMHVTIAYSKRKVNWNDIPDSFDHVQSKDDGERHIEKLGEGEAVVLRFENADLSRRWQEIMDAGASWDWESYKPHVTITYDGKTMDIDDIEPFTGVIKLGPEKFEELNPSWASTIDEDALDD
jgi:hypothetical protein